MSDKIIQTGIGLELGTLTRCDRLRACFGRSRSWVIGQATHVGLAKLEAQKADEIERFGALAERAGMTWQQYTAWYLGEYGAKTHPPTVADLENWERFPGRGGVPRRKAGVTRQTAQDLALAALHAGQAKVAESQKVESPAPAAPRSLRDLR